MLMYQLNESLYFSIRKCWLRMCANQHTIKYALPLIGEVFNPNSLSSVRYLGWSDYVIWPLYTFSMILGPDNEWGVFSHETR